MKKWLLILGIIIVLGGIVYGSYYLIKAKLGKNQSNQTSSGETITKLCLGTDFDNNPDLEFQRTHMNFTSEASAQIVGVIDIENTFSGDKSIVLNALGMTYTVTGTKSEELKKYDGRPFDPVELANRIKDIL
jgi:hypothetical protein